MYFPKPNSRPSRPTRVLHLPAQLLPAVAPQPLNPCVFSWSGIRWCSAVQRLRTLLWVFDVDHQTRFVTWRVYSLHAWTRRTTHPDTCAPGPSVCCRRGLWRLRLGETASQAARSPRKSLTHGPLSSFGDDEEHDACDCVYVSMMLKVQVSSHLLPNNDTRITTISMAARPALLRWNAAASDPDAPPSVSMPPPPDCPGS
jgi:hypothetical protein